MTQADIHSERMTIQTREAGQRLDIYCARLLSQYSRSKLQRAIKEGQINVNGETVKPRYFVREGDQVTVLLIEQAVVAQVPVEMPKISIIHEDSEIVVINKPAGLIVHPSPAGELVSVASWFRGRYPLAVDVGEDSTRPGIVHRLDRDTTGIMVLAKTQESYENLKRQFKKHRAKKEYLTLVYGVPKMAEGRINQAITRSKQNPSRRMVVPKNKESILVGKLAITEWKRERKYGDKYALIRVFPLTGRTHQIRVHMHFISHPIVGDTLYVFKRQKPPVGVTRQLLHAEKLSITLLSGRRKTYTAPLSEDFQGVIDKL